MADATGLRLPHLTRDAAPRAPQPSQRPGPNVRTAIAGSGAFLATLATMLLLSDRAPRVLRRTFGDAAADLSQRFDVEARAMLFLGGGLPEDDTLFHIGLSAVVTLLVALSVWTWRGAAISAAVVFVSSVVLEFAQGRYSTTRIFELRDIQANGVGVIAGLIASYACISAWVAASRLIRTRKQAARS